MRQSRTEGCYCATNDPRILFGLGDTDSIDFKEKFWSDGRQKIWKEPELGKYSTLVKGKVK